MNQLRHLREAAVPPLVQALGHHMEGVRWAAVTLLGEMGGAPAVEALKRYVDDPHIGYQAAQAIQAITRRLEARPDKEEVLPAAPDLSDADLMQAAIEGTSWQLARGREGWTVTVDLPGDRLQRIQCVFSPRSEKATPLVLVYTECGPARPDLYEWALKVNAKLPFGAVGLREVGGQLLFIMVNSFLRETVTAKDLRKSISRLAREADALEKELTAGKDKH
jgi:hypothetical protein